MRRALFGIFALAGLVFSAPTYAEVNQNIDGAIVRLSVQESVRFAPDVATISAGVTSTARGAVDATQKTAAAMTKVVARLKAMGIASADIQTSGVQLNQIYDYDQESQRQIFRGYNASNTVSVKLRNLERVGAVLDALVVEGATDLSGPNFSLDDDDAAKTKARKGAMDRAKKMAQDYAMWAGYSSAKAIEISENIAGVSAYAERGRPMMMMAKSADASPPITPVEAGLVETSVNINFVFKMVP